MSHAARSSPKAPLPGLFAEMLDHIGETVTYIDSNLVIRWINRAQAIALNKSPQQVVGRHCFSVWHKRNSPCPECEIKQVIESGRKAEWNFSDSECSCLVRGVPVTDASGQVCGALHILLNITHFSKEQNQLKTYFGQLEELVAHRTAELHASEENFRRTFQFNPSVLAVTSFDTGTIFDVNAAFTKVTGYSPEEVIGKSVIDLNIWHDPAQRSEFVHTVQTCGSIVNFDARINTKSGEIRDLNISATQFTFNNQPCILTGARDITVRKRAVQALAEEEARYRTIYENCQVAIWEIDYSSVKQFLDSLSSRGITDIEQFFADHTDQTVACVQSLKLIDVNDASIAMFGAASKQQLLDNSFQLAPPEVIAVCPRLFANIAGGALSQEMEITMKTFTGEQLFLLMKWNVLPGYEQSLERVVTSLQDITSFKNAEEARRLSEERMRAIYTHLPVPTYTFRRSGDSFVFVDYNIAANLISRGKLDALMGKSIEALSPDDPGAVKNINRCFSTREPVYYEVNHTFLSTGEIKSLSCIYAFVPPDLVVLHAEDITERKKDEEKLLRYQHKLNTLTSRLTLTAERERRKIASTLHDGLCQTLALAKMKLDAASSAPPDQLHACLQEVESLLKDSIKASRSLTVELSPPVLYELGYEAAVEWLADSVSSQHPVSVSVSLKSPPCPMSENGKVILFLVTRELVLNIIKHARASSALITISSSKKLFRISIKDNGVGIQNPEVQSSRTNGFSGFGLFSVRERLKFLGASFSLSSKPGKGTAARISVPIAALENKFAPLDSPSDSSL